MRVLRVYAFFNDTVDTEVVVPTNRTIEPPRGRNRQRQRTNPNEVETLIVGQSKEPRTATMYRRGDYLQPGDAVGPGMLRALPPLPPEESETAVPDRLDLARWIVDPANPLMPPSPPISCGFACSARDWCARPMTSAPGRTADASAVARLAG